MQKTRSKAHLKPCAECASPLAFGRRKYCGEACRAASIRRRDRARIDVEYNRRKAKEHYWKNREKVLARMSTPEGRAYSRDRMREKMKDPAFRLYSNTSRSIRQAIGQRKGGRQWEALVGYTLADLVAHLERQFDGRMTWENMGEWEVDHIRPRCSFDLSNEDEFRQCWALTNLRPLWAKANRAKSGNRLHLL